MALIPLLLDYLDEHPRPSRIIDQHFGHGLTHEDLGSPRDVRALLNYGPPQHYYRPWRHISPDTGSTVSLDKDKFQVNLDVQQFAPNEVTVKVTGENKITVEGKHEEKADEHGFISRQFVRKYILPKGHNIDKVESSLHSDGVLTITAPKIKNADDEEHRHVPIVHTGKPSRPVEAKKEEKK